MVNHTACFLSPGVFYSPVRLYHQLNTLSPVSCVMSKCVRSLQPRGPCASRNGAAAYRASAEQQQPALISLSFCCPGHLQERTANTAEEGQNAGRFLHSQTPPTTLHEAL